MRSPDHIIIDISKKNLSKTEQYWIFNYFFLIINSNTTISSLSSYKNLFSKNSKFLNKFNHNQIKFTIKYDNSNKSFPSEFKSKNKFLNQNFFNLITNYSNYNIFKITKLTKTFNTLNNDKNLNIFKSDLLWTLFNINFLKKEKMYTKLKYSRVPQYDIVSGGAAALLAGFLGFLITEKFGFELIDSGDFYFLFMYLVFLAFSLRLFLKIMSAKTANWMFFSLKWLLHFYKIIITFIINFIKFLIKLMY